MKGMFLVAVLSLLIGGCDYTVSLVDNPNIDIDQTVVGLWQRARDNGQTEGLLVLPLSGREYMVSFPAGSPDAMFARACLWKGSGMVLVQLKWIGTAQGKLPEDNRIFQYASYRVANDSISIRLLNPQVIQTEVTSAEFLAKVIADNKDNPNLFRAEMIFQRVKE